MFVVGSQGALEAVAAVRGLNSQRRMTCTATPMAGTISPAQRHKRMLRGRLPNDDRVSNISVSR